MGHSIDSRSGSRRSGYRLGRRQPSTDPRTLSAGMRRQIEAQRWKVYGGRAPRPEGWVALEEGVCLEETSRATR